MLRALRSSAAQDVLTRWLGDAGPLDGGCLVCAKAVIRMADRGQLVRLCSQVPSLSDPSRLRAQTDHYGALVNGLIFDGLGMHDSPAAWLQAFTDHLAEFTQPRVMQFVVGYDESDSEIPDEPGAEKEIARLLIAAQALAEEAAMADHERADESDFESSIAP